MRDESWEGAVGHVGGSPWGLCPGGTRSRAGAALEGAFHVPVPSRVQMAAREGQTGAQSVPPGSTASMGSFFGWCSLIFLSRCMGM